MNRKLLTIITSTFNPGIEFDRTAKSISPISDKVQWIVCDGLSNNNSLKIIKSNMNLIDYFISEKDSGIYDAWNKALKFIDTDWVIFLGAGDVFINKNIYEIANVLEKSTSNIIIGNLLLFNSENQFIKKHTNNSLLYKRFKNGTLNTPVNPEVIYSSEIFKKIQFNSKLKIAGDTDFYIRSIINGYKIELINIDIAEMVLDGVSSNPLKITEAINDIRIINKENNLHIPLFVTFIFQFKLITKRIFYMIIGGKLFQKIRIIIKM